MIFFTISLSLVIWQRVPGRTVSETLRGGDPLDGIATGLPTGVPGVAANH
jgi:hypothetical protein